MSTVFSSDSPTSPEKDTQELSTLAAFVAHIERLQDQVRQKDSRILELESSKEELRQRHHQLEHDHSSLTLQMDIQNELLRKTRQTDKHIEQLRTAILDRETVIVEKEKSIRTMERQLEHHKLLLQSEIRRHATLALHTAIDNDPLPELSTLAARKDVDRWIESLHQRLQREKAANRGKEAVDVDESQINSLRQEIDFYVREIIYYKLDVRGYKSDIRKLKRITAQLSSYGNRASDLESDTSSLRPTVTPTPTRLPTTPEIGSSDIPSPILESQISGTNAVDRPITPPSSFSAITGPTILSRDDFETAHERGPSTRSLQFPMTPQTPTRKVGADAENKTDHPDPVVSLHSMAWVSPQRKEPMVC
jgi:hypothetical protein